MRPVAPRIHPGHWHVLRSMRRQRGGADYGRATLAAARWQLLLLLRTVACASACLVGGLDGRRRASARRAEADTGSASGGAHRLAARVATRVTLWFLEPALSSLWRLALGFAGRPSW